MNLREILADLVAIPSLPGTRNDKIADAICNHLDLPGVTLHRIPTPEGRWNILASIGPTDQAGVMLSGHSDVVSAEGQSWSTDPFRLTQVEDRLIGRGTSDMKGFLAVMLTLLPEFLQMPLRRPVHLAFSCDEEIGCQGVPYLIERLPDLIALPQYCIVGEPSGLRPVRSHKGKQSIEVKLTGKPGHSSDPAAGLNALYPAAKLALEIQDIATSLTVEGPFDPAFAPDCSTLQVGLLEGGVAVNIIPEHASMLIEARMIPAQSPHEVINRVLEVLRHIQQSASVADVPLQSKYRVLASYPALSSNDNAELATKLGKLGGYPVVPAVSYGTEAGLFAKAGITSVVCGPGDIARAHRADEFIHEHELTACAEMLRRFVVQSCQA
ncbi:acetylornithine deacetylase [Paracoccus sp. Z330]|uniref:Acetylornithine deacetylase n=1 Tax=Paracoccus onchidii TaxID=3017813 RepID=A0ABT4ZE89_9RHOB|nr:acetylornithine deacetylase [Paracoccus onchidii]MDB6177651.1 acetylornithine deacetylase [Paracoccus onchidii]